MSFKDKISSLLFGSREAEPADETPLPEEEQTPQETPASPETVSEDPNCLEIPMDHPIRQLYDLRRREAGPLPTLRLRVDEEGLLSPEALEKEKGRLQSSLNSVCSTRLKATKGRVRGKHGKKRAEAEEEEELSMDARPWIHLSSDKLYAWMMIFPPVGPGAEVTRDMIQQALSEHGVSFGLDAALLDRVPHDRERYFNLYLAARGAPAFDGRNGNILDYFPRELQRTLDVNEFGQVDYTALNLICNVEEGQEICRLIHPTEGEPGRTVTNQEIPAKSGRPVPLPKGRNTEASEDGETLVATMPGHVEFSGNSFQVKPVLDIDGDVDFSTGSIKFVGDVNIKGDVISGFSVRAMGNIYVGGVVETGVTVEAGGDLTVVKGILGDGTTVIRAGRCVFSKYIENATILVRENLQTDCIVNSRIYCDGEVQVRSGRGSIMGGQIWAAKRVSASAVGARSEVRTSVTLGGMPRATLEKDLVRKELKNLAIEMERLDAQLDNPAKASLLGKTRMKISVAENRLKQLNEEMEQGQEDLKKQEEPDSGRMECGVAYAGTEIIFGKKVLRLRQETHQCVAKLVYGEIVLM